MSTSEREQESPKLTYEERGEIATGLMEKAITNLKDSPAFQRAVVGSFLSEFLSCHPGAQAINIPTEDGHCRVVVRPSRSPILAIHRYVNISGSPLRRESCTIDLSKKQILHFGEDISGPGGSPEAKKDTREAVEGAENLIAFVAGIPLLGNEEADALTAGDGTAHSL